MVVFWGVDFNQGHIRQNQFETRILKDPRLFYQGHCFYAPASLMVALSATEM